MVTRFWYFFSESIEYFNKKIFLLKFSFPWKFFLEKWEKISTEQFFCSIFKQVEKNLIMPNVVEDTLWLQEKFFTLILKRAF